jgi:hypothetical protein
MVIGLQRVKAAVPRKCGNPLMEAGVVLHRARAKRVETGIKVNIALADLGVVPDQLRFGHLRKSGWLGAQELCRDQLADSDLWNPSCWRGEGPPSRLGLLINGLG